MPPRRRRRIALLLLLSALATCAPADRSAAPSQERAASGAEVPPGPLEMYAPGADRAAVVGTLQLLFDALESGDEELLRRVLEPSVLMRFAEVRDGETTHGRSTVDALATRIVSAEEPLIERMWDPVVLVNGPLATVWTPYDFYVGEAFSHCGIDVATMLRTDDGWRIAGLSWTRLQPPACELHPDGPPTT